jgi:MFS transporter, MCT family, solute carrier family 16 (monocarboxylic acid transporters), member 10
MIPLISAAAILTFAWPFAHSCGSLIAVTILYGFAAGSYISLVSIPPINLGDIDDVGRRIGMMMSILAIGALCGPPISGAIHTATEGGGFENVGYYAGSTILMGVGLMIAVKYTKMGRFGGKM